MKVHFLTVLFLVSMPLKSISQKNGELCPLQKVETYLSQMEEVGFTGVVLIELDEQPKLSKGYGLRDKQKQLKNSPETIFDIGSITKQFTAAAILKLEMQEKLSVHDKLLKFFPNIPPDKKDISIHDLLRHQSGLIRNVGNDYEKISEVDFLNKVFSSELQSEPGSEFSYSNIGYSLLALIIERVSNHSYESYLYKHLWEPLRMESTGYTRPDFDLELIAMGHTKDQPNWGKPTDKEWDTMAPYLHLKGNGGILSTTEDLYKWHRSMFTEQVLSKEAKHKMVFPEIRPEETRNSYYAYGWDVSQTNRNTIQVWHNGSNNVFYADFLRYPDEGVAVIMLSNSSHPNFDQLGFEIAKIIFNPNYKPYIPATDNEENRKFTNAIIKTIEESGLEKAKEVYSSRNRSQHLLEFLMRKEGFNCLDKQQPETALLIFEMNVFANPASAKALQGLAEGYMETGKTEAALKYFNESLRINSDNPFANEMVKKLKK